MTTLEERPSSPYVERFRGEFRRPLTLTPTLIETIAADVRNGIKPNKAIERWVSKWTRRDWQKRADGALQRREQQEEPQRDDLLFIEMVEEIERAEIDYLDSVLADAHALARPHKTRRVTVKEEPLRIKGEVQLNADGSVKMLRSTQVVEEETGDVNALIKLLERRIPEDFKPVARTELTGADGGPVQIDITDLERSLATSMRKVGRPVGDQDPDLDIIEAEIVGDDPADRWPLPSTTDDLHDDSYIYALYAGPADD